MSPESKGWVWREMSDLQRASVTALLSAEGAFLDAAIRIWERQAELMQIEAELSRNLFLPLLPGQKPSSPGEYYARIQASSDRLVGHMRGWTSELLAAAAARTTGAQSGEGT